MNTALTIGNFDGVHLGHKRLIERVLEFARQGDLTPALLTFDPHPTRVVAPARTPRLLTTLQQREKLIRAEGIELIEALPFTAATAQLTPEEFVRGIVVERLGARAVVVGRNFRFGHKAAGDVHTLRELGIKYGFETAIAEEATWRGITISSSGIRALILEGKVSRACRMLGRPYALEGTVVHGHGIGAKKTVPTLNLSTAAEVLPAVGVYITETYDISDLRRWHSVTNVGYRPTFGSDDRLTVETFLLDPLEGPTPRAISVRFLKRLREERKFDNAEALKAQILRDVKRSQTYFRRLRQRKAYTEIETSRT
jgi:riboflavin kinase/FMN adenylyltransferase